MTMWLYQMNQAEWSPKRYRAEIWEGERWAWPVKKALMKDSKPEPGDTVVFFYAKSHGMEPGFYGWGVVLEWLDKIKRIYFRPASPSDYLKMNPWWDDEAKLISDQIRGKVMQGTLWKIENDLANEVRSGIRQWISSS